jgi:hypothetical protein
MATIRKIFGTVITVVKNLFSKKIFLAKPISLQTA